MLVKRMTRHTNFYPVLKYLYLFSLLFSFYCTYLIFMQLHNLLNVGNIDAGGDKYRWSQVSWSQVPDLRD